MSDALRALLYALQQGALTPSAAPAVFVRAEADPALRELLPSLVCEQTFKPEYDRIAALGFKVSRRAEGPCGTALCLLTKNKLENLANIARAWSMLDPGGLLICSGAKDSGAASIEKQARTALGKFETLSKYHCRVFWTRRSGPMPAPAADWLAAGELHVVPETGYLSRPGIYGWNGIDEGSRLLAAHLPPDITGRVADLGAGWGFLSLSLLEHCPDIASLDLYDAEWLALDAARANIDVRRPGASVDYHWHDVTRDLPAQRYDTIVMNPPFHSGKATDVALGRAFIAAAAASLVPGGTLLMVANRHLPYEAAIDAHLKARQTLAETAAFKIIRATAR